MTAVAAVAGIAIIAALTTCDIRRINRQYRQAIAEMRAAEALTAALKAHDQDIDQLTAEADLPPGEFEAAWQKWQDRQ